MKSTIDNRRRRLLLMACGVAAPFLAGVRAASHRSQRGSVAAMWMPRLRFLTVGQALIDYDLRQSSRTAVEEAASYLKGADVVFTNLENAVTEPDVAQAASGGDMVHGAPVDVLDCLKAMGFNLLALSSNHAWDAGEGGLRRTRSEAARRGFAVAGIGANVEEASEPGFLSTSQGRVALVSMASGSSQLTPERYATATRPGVNMLSLTPEGQVDQDDVRRVIASIGSAAARAPFVVVYHHSHIAEAEGEAPPEWRRSWAHQCLDAGGSIYIAHGLPRLSGIEIYNGKPILYGLGNFIFHTRQKVGYYPREAWQSLVVDCQFERDTVTSVTLRPLTLNESGDQGATFYQTRGVPRLAVDQEARTILEQVRDLSKPLGTTIVISKGTGEICLNRASRWDSR